MGKINWRKLDPRDLPSIQFRASVLVRVVGTPGEYDLQDASRTVCYKLRRLVDDHAVEFQTRGLTVESGTPMEFDPVTEAEPYDRSWRTTKGRLFKSGVFLGNGDNSMIDAAILHARLDAALSELTGLQQGYPDKSGRIKAGICRVALDIATALTGRVVSLGDRISK